MDPRDLRRRRARVLSAVLLLSATASSAADLEKRSHSLVTADGRTRDYDVYFPAPLDPRELPLGLLIVLHGGAGSKEAMPVLTCPDGLSGNPKCLNRTIAESGRRYFVVYPDGTGALKSWNAGKCCGFAMENGVDDVGFIARLLDVLPTDYPYDPNRVYVTGFSNGAMLAHRLGCELANRIAAIAPVAGGIGIESATCRPSRALPVLTFHGTADPSYPYEGGMGSALPGVSFTGIPETVDGWAARNDCDPAFLETQLPDRPPDSPDDQTVVFKQNYSGCRGAGIVAHHRIENGGHTWPAGFQYLPVYLIGRTTNDVSANDAMLEFFSAHALNRVVPIPSRARSPRSVPPRQ